MSSFFGFSFCYLFYIFGSPKKDDEGNLIEDEFTSLPLPSQFFKRMLREIDYYNKMMSQPVTDKLLPDPLSPPYYQPKYTLILELTDLLTHADWTYQTGWRFKKRPGVDKFLELVTMPLFELVVFTSEQSVAAYPLLEVLDPNGYIMYKLSKTSAEFSDGHYVKNLDCLNRDLSKVIVVDWNENAVKFHRNNALIIPRWTGEDDDTTLVDLAVFLRTIAASNIDDVREVLSFYGKYENPVEAFRENQRKLLEQMEENEEKEKKKGVSLASKWADKFLKQQNRFK
ncbi:mitochondrial import inner membrane translocase subunit TIM50-C-like [Lycorma delicatula]|uniref:mitochondrial import inner membrane translocase subunit TIM50-C-like n=1 Tax=Lycorma delicatula TaxID=130591 RepID=UPI003F519F7F